MALVGPMLAQQKIVAGDVYCSSDNVDVLKATLDSRYFSLHTKNGSLSRPRKDAVSDKVKKFRLQDIKADGIQKF